MNNYFITYHLFLSSLVGNKRKEASVLMLIFIGQYTEYECSTLTRNTNAFSLLK